MTKRRALIVIVLAFVHYVTSWIVLSTAFGMGIDSFEHGSPTTRAEMILTSVGEGMQFPAYPISMWIGLGQLAPLHIMLEILNSLLWGTGLYLLFAGFSGFRRGSGVASLITPGIVGRGRENNGI